MSSGAAASRPAGAAATSHRSFVPIAAAAFALELALFSTLAPLLPHYESELGMSSFASGVLAGCYTAGSIVGTLIAGIWGTTRLGVRTTSLAGCGVVVLGTVGFGAAGSVLALDLTRALIGVGSGLIWCGLLGWLILVVPAANRGAAMGAAIGAAVFGSAAGPLLGAAMQAVGTFPICVAIAAVVALYAALLLRQPAPREAAGDATVTGLRIPPDPLLRWSAWANLVPPLVAGAVATIIPLRLAELGAGEAGIDAALFLAALLSALCFAQAGRLGDRAGMWRPLLLGILASAITLAAMAPLTSPLALALVFVLFRGAGVGYFWMATIGLLTERAEASGMAAAAAAVVLNLILTAAYTVGPPLFTALEAATGPAVPFLAMAAICLVTLATALPQRRAAG